jgi:putative Mg2+ transporter-C (MgtC) family protein
VTPPAALLALFDVDFIGLATSFICMITAFVLGTAIGLERQWRQRTAGLRTNVLVAVELPPSPILVCACPALMAGFG